MVLDGEMRLYKWPGARVALAANREEVRFQAELPESVTLPHGRGTNRADAIESIRPAAHDHDERRGQESTRISAAPRSRHGQVEVQHLLPRAELLVECDRRIVAAVGLHEHHPRAALMRDHTQLPDQLRGDALSAV